MNAPSMKQIQDELRAAHKWKAAGEPKKANAFLRSALAGLKALAFSGAFRKGRAA